jgi:transcriptional regulator with XRE-family HTH domain
MVGKNRKTEIKAMSQSASAIASEAGFGGTLRRWRRERRLSQLDLSLAADVSQRHVSFMESGRARPSRAMVLQLAEALDLPLRECNRLLVAAGFAPAYASRELSDPDMAPVRQALELMLSHHEPNPALVLDRNWNLLTANRAMERSFGMLDDPQTLWRRVCGDGPRNLLKLTFHPQGARPFIRNWAEVAGLLLWRGRREAEATANDTLHAVVDEILGYEGIPKRWRMPSHPDAPPPPILPLEYVIGGQSLKLFSMLSSFGTPQDVTADEIRVESFFPADDASAALLRILAENSSD